MSLWCSKHQKRFGRLGFCWGYEDKDNKDDAYLPWSVCANCVYAGKEGERSEHAGQEYRNGPWATGGSDSCPDYPRYESSDWSYTDATGPYRFLGPGVSDKDKVKQPIQIEPLKQGFLVEYVYDLEAAQGFTDRMDLAEWLLGWLGFDEDMYCLVVDPEDLPDCKYDLDWPDAYTRLLDVVGAAEAFVEYTHPPTFDALKEAIKKWRGIEGRRDGREEAADTPLNALSREELVEIARSARGIQADKLLDKDNAEEVFSNPLLDIAEAAWAYIEAHGADAQRNEYLKLAEAANKWRMTEDEESPKTDANT